VIKSFKDRKTQQIFTRQRSRRLPSDIQQVALRKLRMLDNAHAINDLQVPPANRLEKLTGIARDNTTFGSMTAGASALRGATMTPMTSRLSATTRRGSS
jgi:plasmid maintenance system killer protein